MKLWTTQAIAHERGARQGPVGVLSGSRLSDSWKFGTFWAGNSVSDQSAPDDGALPSCEKEMKWSRQATSLPAASSPPASEWNPPTRKKSCAMSCSRVQTIFTGPGYRWAIAPASHM
jgi:hypothetical protein